MKGFKKCEDTMYYYRDFGKAVTAVRNILGISQKSAAKLAGVGEKYLRSIEKGKLNLEDDKLNRLLTSLSKLWTEERLSAVIEKKDLSQKQRIGIFLSLFTKLK